MQSWRRARALTHGTISSSSMLGGRRARALSLSLCLCRSEKFGTIVTIESLDGMKLLDAIHWPWLQLADMLKSTLGYKSLRCCNPTACHQLETAPLFFLFLSSDSPLIRWARLIPPTLISGLSLLLLHLLFTLASTTFIIFSYFHFFLIRLRIYSSAILIYCIYYYFFLSPYILVFTETQHCI